MEANVVRWWWRWWCWVYEPARHPAAAAAQRNERPRQVQLKCLQPIFFSQWRHKYQPEVCFTLSLSTDRGWVLTKTSLEGRVTRVKLISLVRGCMFQANNDTADTGASNADTDEWADDSSNDGNDGSVHGSMISGAVDY